MILLSRTNFKDLDWAMHESQNLIQSWVGTRNINLNLDSADLHFEHGFFAPVRTAEWIDVQLSIYYQISPQYRANYQFCLVLHGLILFQPLPGLYTLDVTQPSHILEYMQLSFNGDQVGQCSQINWWMFLFDKLGFLGQAEELWLLFLWNGVPLDTVFHILEWILSFMW